MTACSIELASSAIVRGSAKTWPLVIVLVQHASRHLALPCGMIVASQKRKCPICERRRAVNRAADRAAAAGDAAGLTRLISRRAVTSRSFGSSARGGAGHADPRY